MAAAPQLPNENKYLNEKEKTFLKYRNSLPELLELEYKLDTPFQLSESSNIADRYTPKTDKVGTKKYISLG